MGNCLVTKLASIVSNEELLKEDEILVRTSQVETPSESSQKMSIRVADTTSYVSAVGNGSVSTSYPASGQTKVNIDANTLTDLYVSNGAKVKVGKKRNIFLLSVSGINLDDLKYSTFLQSIISSNASGNIGSLANSASARLAEIYLNYSPSVRGNIEDLSGCSVLRIISLPNTGVVGNVDNLEQVNLQYLRVDNCSKLTGQISSLAKFTGLGQILATSSGLEGTLESYAEAAYRNNKTSDTEVSARGTVITFHGLGFNAPLYVKFNANYGGITYDAIICKNATLSDSNVLAYYKHDAANPWTYV